jgi:hypothetical protein
VNSHKFTWKSVNSQIFKLFREIFLSFLHIRGGNMEWIVLGTKDLLWKSPWEAILALFAVHTGKKRFREKCEFFCEFTRIRVKIFEFNSTVYMLNYNETRCKIDHLNSLEIIKNKIATSSACSWASRQTKPLRLEIWCRPWLFAHQRSHSKWD